MILFFPFLTSIVEYKQKIYETIYVDEVQK